MSNTDSSKDKWKYIAQRGYFSHDDDPESWDFRATTLPNLGLLPREYPSDTDFDPSPQRSQWERFTHYLNTLNEANPERQRYKLLYIIRHGQGTHNVKETEVGREEWDRHWARISGDGTTVWEDAALTPVGEQQARDIASFFGEGDVPRPEKIYSSPLRRCLRTTELAYPSILSTSTWTAIDRPAIKENLRERLGVHTCDKRSSKTYIASVHPSFTIAPGFTEEDELWKADVRESFEEHVMRKTKLLDELFDDGADGSLYVSLTAHSGALMALFGATGWRKIPVAAGAVYPLLVLAQRSD